MEPIKLSESVSLLDFRFRDQQPMPVRVVLSIVSKSLGVALLLSALCGPATAFTTIVSSTSAPAGLEQTLIAGVTTQFAAALTVNPFFPNTYQVTLFGPNPAYNPPVTQKQLLDALVTVDSWTYVYGWVDGESYQTYTDSKLAGYYDTLCANATNFALVQTTTKTFNMGTCQDVLGTMIGTIYNQHVSTPTVVPGNWQ